MQELRHSGKRHHEFQSEKGMLSVYGTSKWRHVGELLYLAIKKIVQAESFEKKRLI